MDETKRGLQAMASTGDDPSLTVPGGKRRGAGEGDGRDGKKQRTGKNLGARALQRVLAFKKSKGSRKGQGNSSSEAASPNGEEAAEEVRRPKRKVALLIGYCGTGYKGLQANRDEKTIEGDLFGALVAAGAISKANSTDPKKSSFARCARTDKGVHAARNVVSLKMIVEDKDIIDRINSHLPPQIRVWGYVRTVGSFNCYYQCDRRIYEYLLPTHVLLPSHPRSYLGQKILEAATDANDLDGLRDRQGDEWSFWKDAEAKEIGPLMRFLNLSAQDPASAAFFQPDPAAGWEGRDETTDPLEPATAPGSSTAPDASIRRLKAAYHKAKQQYRLSEKRLGRLREVLHCFLGNNNFHNYTVQKSFRDPSAKRLIYSVEAGKPFIIGDTEWLSIQFQGQSFMMHQIRKMISMAVLIVRTGCYAERITQSYGPAAFSIPKAPGLGLLLDQPLFVEYNRRATEDFQREQIPRNAHEEAVNAFKKKFIYEHIYGEEKTKDIYETFFTQLDNSVGPNFLWLTSGGQNKLLDRRADREVKKRRHGAEHDAQDTGLAEVVKKVLDWTDTEQEDMTNVEGEAEEEAEEKVEEEGKGEQEVKVEGKEKAEVGKEKAEVGQEENGEVAKQTTEIDQEAKD